MRSGGVAEGGLSGGRAQHEDVVAEGWVTRRGRTVVFCESEAFGATTGRLVAKSVLTYNVSKAE